MHCWICNKSFLQCHCYHKPEIHHIHISYGSLIQGNVYSLLASIQEVLIYTSVRRTFLFIFLNRSFTIKKNLDFFFISIKLSFHCENIGLCHFTFLYKANDMLIRRWYLHDKNTPWACGQPVWACGCCRGPTALQCLVYLNIRQHMAMCRSPKSTHSLDCSYVYNPQHWIIS